MGDQKMRPKVFKPGDEVAVSAGWLDSQGTVSFISYTGHIGGGFSTHDPGIGIVQRVEDGWLVHVLFKTGPRSFRDENLVHREDIYLDVRREQFGAKP